MVESKWSYTITHYDRSNSWTTQSLGSVFIAAPIFTDTGDGTVNSAIIKIDANKGHYIRDQRAGESGFPTKIDIYDRIEITVLDGFGGSYQRYFDIIKKIPIKDNSNATVLQLELLGIEHWLQKVQYSSRSFLLNAQELLTDLVTVYTANKTTDMPSLTIGTNELPPIFVNLDWGTNEDSIYNRLMDLLNALGASGANGGVLDYFEAEFSTQLNAITLNVRTSGNENAGKPDVTIATNSVSIIETEGGISGATGTLINAWGAMDAGSLPTNFSKWKSKRLVMPTNTISLFPIWNNGAKYKTGTIIKYKVGIYYNVYKRTGADITSVPAGAPNVTAGWTLLTTATYLVDSNNNQIVYSPWTKGNNIYWKNSGGDPSGAAGSPYGPCTFDGNVIINDDNTFRTWVDVLNTNGLINTFWLYGANSSGVYDGLRVLVNGTGTGVFAGFSNHIMEYQDGEWKSKYAPETNMLVMCFDTARVYKYTGSWGDISGQGNALDCLHPYDGGTTHNSTSAITDSDTNAEYSNNEISSVKTIYTWTPLDDWTTVFGGTTVDYYKSGAWLSLRFPLPINTYNYTPSTHVVGESYGGTTSTKAPTVLDIQNMNYTHDGKRGFNHGDSSEDLGPISSLDFMSKIYFTALPAVGDGHSVDSGNFKMRCVVTDSNDNVAFQDFVIEFNNNWQSVSLPISGFQSVRNLRPRAIALSSLFPPKAVDVSTQFEWRHLKMFTIQTQESYDDSGRYLAGNGRFGVSSLISHLSNGAPASGSFFRLELFVDALRFTKPLLVNSGQVTGGDSLLLSPDFLQRPDIFIYDQLKSDVMSEKARFEFPVEEYTVTTNGKFDVSFGDYFMLNDTELVDRTDTGNNIIKLVAKTIEYSITKPIDGVGGFLRNIRGLRRFV